MGATDPILETASCDVYVYFDQKSAEPVDALKLLQILTQGVLPRLGRSFARR